MLHLENFNKETQLISKFGLEKAHLVWVMALYLDYPDLEQLAVDALTDGNDDKKIDFFYIDLDARKVVIAQGYFSDKGVYKAKANKASDLNTALAWIISGDLDKLRDDCSGRYNNDLKSIALNFRNAVEKKEIDEIELLYVHNLAESQNVKDELETVKKNLDNLLVGKDISVYSKELGIQNIETIYRLKSSVIAIEDKVTLPAKAHFEIDETQWKSGIFTVKGIWLKKLYEKYDDSLFSANYRGFLGIGRSGRKRINLGIKNSAESFPENFWAYNNGITILTTKFEENTKGETILHGLSIINGAQTTGSISQAPDEGLNNVKVLCRVIEAKDAIIDSIIEYNNTQNEIKTWDKFSKRPEQERIKVEFDKLGYSYGFKRGFGSQSDLTIETIAQPASALHGHYVLAGSGKNNIFLSENLYKDVFEESKSKHLLLAYCLLKSIDVRHAELKKKNTEGSLTAPEQKQLNNLNQLRFKYFILSLIGDCLETILGQKADLKHVAYGNGIAGSRHNTIQQLIEKNIPFVRQFINTTTRALNEIQFSDIIGNKDKYKEIKDRIENSIGDLKEMNTTNVYDDFSKLIVAKG